MLTTQEAYEQIRAYFSFPDAVLARTQNDACYYRDPSGNKCAVGVLIPDELLGTVVDDESHYDPLTLGEWIEGKSVDELAKMYLLKEIVNGEDEEGLRKLSFLSDAQKAHDKDAKDAAHLVRLLDELADGYLLKVVVSS